VNYTVLLLLTPLSLWVFTVPVPPNSTVIVKPSLPPLCNATEPLALQGPATVNIVCSNPTLAQIKIAGWIYVEPPPPTPPKPIPAPRRLSSP